MWHHHRSNSNSSSSSTQPSYAYQAYKQQFPTVADGDAANQETLNTNTTAQHQIPTFSKDDLFVLTRPEEPVPSDEEGEMLGDCPKILTLSTFEGQSTPFKYFIKGDGNDSMAESYQVQF